jgi:hypothetical protein
MNETQSSTTPAPDEQANLAACLQRQITLLLLAMIIVSGTLSTYLFYQARTLNRDLTELQPQARLVVENYDNNLPHIQKFVQALIAYGQKHPDFEPILKKYGIPLTLPVSTNSVPKK